jgi:hypothetical protein
MDKNLQEANRVLDKALGEYAEALTRKRLFLTEKIGLTERERKFAMYVISNAVMELKEYRRREKRTAEFEDIEEYHKDAPEQIERTIGYGYGQHNAARSIAGSSLSSLFGGMGIDTIYALEALAEREDIHTHCPVIVEEYYKELEKQWTESA